MDIHVYLHDVPGSVSQALESILTQVGALMATVADVKTAIDNVVAKTTSEETTLNSAMTLLNGLSAIIADLKAQLAAALASADPAALQAAVDAVNALGVKIDADKQALANAVVANTPAAT